MVARRDSELTSPDQAQMFDQIRGLFRHVPFTARDFANLAPNVAETLSPKNPEGALAVFWDVLDKQESNKYLEALLVLLGFSAESGNVLNRKTDFNTDVHPRTVARWADTALTGVVRYIDENYRTAYAVIRAQLAFDAQVIQVQFSLESNIEMEAPDVYRIGNAASSREPVAQWAEDTRQYSFDVSLDGWPDFDASWDDSLFEVAVTWHGPVLPRFEVTILGARPNMLRVEQSAERLTLTRLG